MYMFSTFTLSLLLWVLSLTSSAQAFTVDGQEDICANTVVILCENFESLTAGSFATNYGGGTSGGTTASHYKNSGWQFRDQNFPGDPGAADFNPDGVLHVVTDVKFDGSKGMRFTYPNNTGSQGYEAFFAGESEMYLRWYVKWSTNWVLSGVGDKAFYVNTTGYAHNILCGNENSANGVRGALTCSIQGGAEAGTQASNKRINLGGCPAQNNFADNAWHYYELHIKMNTTNSSTDGLYEAWFDGCKFAYHPNINIDRNGTKATGVRPSGYWNCSPYTGSDVCSTGTLHNFIMYRWYDNIVVSRQRIGANGAPPPVDTTAPPTPSGISVVPQ